MSLLKMSLLNKNEVSMHAFGKLQHVRSIYTLMVIGLSTLASPVFAGDGADVKATEPTVATEHLADFKKLDANSDGKLVDKEVASDKLLASKFKFADTDGDGGINADEYEKFKKMVYLK